MDSASRMGQRNRSRSNEHAMNTRGANKLAAITRTLRYDLEDLEDFSRERFVVGLITVVMSVLFLLIPQSSAQGIPAIFVTVGFEAELAVRCVKSIDFEYGHLVVLFSIEISGVDSAAREISQLHPRATIIRSTYNIGCAGSWNYLLIHYPHLLWWLFVNGDVTFPPGALSEFSKISTDAFELKKNVAVVIANIYWSLFSLSRSAVEVVGLFDENFFPAYEEDLDYQARLHASGLNIIKAPVLFTHRGYALAHTEAGTFASASNGVSLAQDAVRMISSANNRRYLEAKWAGQVVDGMYVGTFRFPFNESRNHISMWIFNSRRRNCIMSMEYDCTAPDHLNFVTLKGFGTDLLSTIKNVSMWTGVDRLAFCNFFDCRISL